MGYNPYMTVILGIKLANRLDAAIEFQKVITDFGCAIQTRIGLHETNERHCSSSGIILLEVIDHKIIQNLEQELLKIDNIEIQRMVFN